MTKLSIVIPNKNRNAYLGRSLQAWREQNLFENPEDLELLLCDDGSDSPPVDLCMEYGAKLIPVVPNKARMGPCIAWNEGLRSGTGEVLACTHPEIVPDSDVARYLYGACTGNPEFLQDLSFWIPDISEDWTLIERPMTVDDILRLREFAVRANVVVLRMAPDIQVPAEPRLTQADPAFWDFKTEFGGHTNGEIRWRLRGFFWNNLFAMRREVWKWINYFRPSNDWGVDDSDFQERNSILKITYAFTDDTFAYHQYHGPEFRGPINDHFKFVTEEDARLLHLYPETAREELNLCRTRFWDHS